MSPRERVLAALGRRKPDKVPREISYGAFTPALMEVFREKTGADDPAEYFDFEVRPVAFRPTRVTRQVPPEVAGLSGGGKGEGEGEGEVTIDEWGVAFRKGSSYHFVRLIHHPLGRAQTVSDVEEFMFPDFMEPYRHEHFDTEVKRWHDRGYAVMGELYQTIFEIAWFLRGMENLLVDFMVNPDIAAALLDRLTELRCRQAVRYAEAGVDILRLGDDIASQRGLVMSPETWRRWLKPRLGKVIAAARGVNPGIHVFYHCDGDPTVIIPELIEVGVDVLNPVQPECMDPARVKMEYGDRLAFWGTIGTQSTMPFGTPDEVRRVVKERVEVVGKGGGLLLAPTHILEPEVPWENILAFFEAIEEYGWYR
ncbi:MAG: hypothetical protein HPY52_10400 [Firmicutes bacterium]|nr:hypothetical protein [Bacillota bacterium]